MTDKEFSEHITAMAEMLYRVSYSRLSRACDREDAVQETLCKAWEKRRSIKDERFIRTWIIRILINECNNVYRKKKREILPGEMPERTVPSNANPELHDALFRLDIMLRLPIVLHYVEGFSISEIAHMLHLPQGTVKSRMRKGRHLLNEMLYEEV